VSHCFANLTLTAIEWDQIETGGAEYDEKFYLFPGVNRPVEIVDYSETVLVEIFVLVSNFLRPFGQNQPNLCRRLYLQLNQILKKKNFNFVLFCCKTILP